MNQVGAFQVRTGQVKSGLAKSSHYRSSWYRLSKVRTGQVKLERVKSARSSWINFWTKKLMSSFVMLGPTFNTTQKIFYLSKIVTLNKFSLVQIANHCKRKKIFFASHDVKYEVCIYTRILYYTV